ncbi:MAG: type II toxin-antitoxin system HicB family antitoxin [Spirochaetota bacterium]|nr:type II toxin-antitoxin system HicB family antitoxin [Spirochaetota bacterium]
MDFYTAVLKQNNGYWLALCLENGIVGQDKSKDMAVLKLREAVSSFEEARALDTEIANQPLTIKELHEFIAFEGSLMESDSYELRAISA